MDADSLELLDIDSDCDSLCDSDWLELDVEIDSLLEDVDVDCDSD